MDASGRGWKRADVLCGGVMPGAKSAIFLSKTRNPLFLAVVFEPENAVAHDALRTAGAYRPRKTEVRPLALTADKHFAADRA